MRVGFAHPRSSSGSALPHHGPIARSLEFRPGWMFSTSCWARCVHSTKELFATNMGLLRKANKDEKKMEFLSEWTKLSC
jgi:hypothetical protein